MESITTYAIHADPTFEGTYPLSAADLQIPPRSIRLAFIYSTDKETRHDKTNTKQLITSLQEGLRALLRPLDNTKDTTAKYPELLGKIIRPQDGRLPYIAVEKSSHIPFNVAYRLDIDFERLSPEQRFPVNSLPKADFATGLDSSEFLAQHNCAIQLTFINGGFVLVLQILHVITDIDGYAGVVHHWFQRIKALMSEDQYVLSSTAADNVHDKTELLKDFDESLYAPSELKALRTWKDFYRDYPPSKTGPFGEKEKNIRNQIWWFSNDNLEKLRAEMHKYTTDRPTVHESLTALAWRCITRARITQNTFMESTVSFAAFVINIRKRLVPPLPAEFFGNAITTLLTPLPLSTVLDRTETFTVMKAIQSLLREDTSDPNLRSLTKFHLRQLKAGNLPPTDLLERDVFFNSWEHIFPSLDIMDIGAGRFCTMRFMTDHPLMPAFVMVMPSYGMRQKASDSDSDSDWYSGIELLIHLLPHQMENLKKDEEWVQYASIC